MSTPDIDNLQNFIQYKPIEGLIYHNDINFVEDRSKILWDNVGTCRGRIKISVVAMEMDLMAEEGKENTIVI